MDTASHSSLINITISMEKKTTFYKFYYDNARFPLSKSVITFFYINNVAKNYANILKRLPRSFCSTILLSTSNF